MMIVIVEFFVAFTFITKMMISWLSTILAFSGTYYQFCHGRLEIQKGFGNKRDGFLYPATDGSPSSSPSEEQPVDNDFFFNPDDIFADAENANNAAVSSFAEIAAESVLGKHYHFLFLAC
jgi:hypothetical protein